MTITQAHRRIIKDKAEARGCKYRITATGEVHFYGTMPNTSQTGWFLFAHNVEKAIACNA